MTDNNSRQSDSNSRTNEPTPNVETDGGEPEPGEPRRGAKRTDGGVATGGRTADTDYLDSRVNIFKPSTPFMRDHLRIVWTMFAAWAVFVFGPVTATYLATDFMTSVTVLGFPLHYLSTAIGAPTGALLLSFVYARKRDQLDEEYGVDHSTGATSADAEGEPAATDGGDDR
jgi:putative solute:sodium symporter small subunit